MVNFGRVLGVNLVYGLVLLQMFIGYCVGTRESAKIHNILSGNITGDLVPSAYPVLKINQSANNDSSFYKFYRDELNDIEDETLKLIAKQRKVFERLRKKEKEQNRLFEDLAIASQRL